MDLLNCFRLPRCSLVGFSFISSFTEHMIFSHSLLPYFQVEYCPLLCGVVIYFCCSFFIRWFHFYSVHWTNSNEILCFPSIYYICNTIFVTFRYCITPFFIFWMCISIWIPRQNCLVSGCNLMMMIFCFKCFGTGYPVMGFVLYCY